MNDIDGSTRNENGENGGIIKTSSIRGAELGLGEETEVWVHKFSRNQTGD